MGKGHDRVELGRDGGVSWGKNCVILRHGVSFSFTFLALNATDAMDTDPVVQAGPSLGALPADPSVVVHAAASSSCVRQRNSSEGSSDVSMGKSFWKSN